MRKYFVALALVFLTAPAFAEVPTVKIAGTRFVGIGYTIDRSGEFVVYASPQQVGDKLAICGFVVIKKGSNSTTMMEKNFTERTQFKLSGQKLIVSTSLFKRYTSDDDAIKGVAGCSTTNVAWSPAFAKTKLEMELPSMTLRN